MKAAPSSMQAGAATAAGWGREAGRVRRAERAVRWTHPAPRAPPISSSRTKRAFVVRASVGASSASSSSPAGSFRGAASDAGSTTADECLEVAGMAKLEGHVRISGAKNSALALFAATLLCSKGEMLLRRVPQLVDLTSMSEVLASVGCACEFGVEGNPENVVLNTQTLTSCTPSVTAVRKLRASFLVAGPLLARLGEACLPLPGGCNIGARPVDLHIRGLQAMGAEVEMKDGRVYLRSGAGGSLQGAKIYLDYPSVGATETIMMAAVLAEGETKIANVAQEPEVVDLADMLNCMGAKVRGAGTNTITIEGVKELRGVEYSIIPDRIEAGTFLVAGAITNSMLSIGPVCPQHLTAVTAKLQETGCQVIVDKPDVLRIVPSEVLSPVDITTLPYPGFPTDMQSQFMSLLTMCDGTSVVRETVFENRMKNVEQLRIMGGKIKMAGSGSAVVEGQGREGRLHGAHVEGGDLRASAALVLAGLAAQGVTTVAGLKHLDRGYFDFEGKLRSLGADVRRVPRQDLSSGL